MMMGAPRSEAGRGAPQLRPEHEASEHRVAYSAHAAWRPSRATPRIRVWRGVAGKSDRCHNRCARQAPLYICRRYARPACGSPRSHRAAAGIQSAPTLAGHRPTMSMIEPSMCEAPPCPNRGKRHREPVVLPSLSNTSADPNHVDWLRRLARPVDRTADIERTGSPSAILFGRRAPSLAPKVVAILGPGTLRISWMETRDLHVPEPTAVRVSPLDRCRAALLYCTASVRFQS